MSSHHHLWVRNLRQVFELLDTSLPLPEPWGGMGSTHPVHSPRALCRALGLSPTVAWTSVPGDSDLQSYEWSRDCTGSGDRCWGAVPTPVGLACPQPSQVPAPSLFLNKEPLATWQL